MLQGWIKLYRKIRFHPVFVDPVVLKLFILCLLKAGHKATTIIFENLNKPIFLKAGQFVTGRNSLHRDFYFGSPKGTRRVSKRTLWRKLHILKNLKIVSLSVSKRYTVVTIVNWDTYQKNKKQSVQEDVRKLSDSCPTAVHKQEEEEKVKEGLNSDLKSEKSKSDLPLDADYQPTPVEFENIINNLKRIVKT
jgi:hypothetical protein